MSIDPETFAHKLIELGEQRLLSPEERAQKIGMSFRQYKRWEAGSVEPRLANVRKVAEAYDIAPAEMLAELADQNGSFSARLERIERSLALLEQGLARLLTAITPQTEGARDLHLEDVLTPPPTQEAPEGTGGQGTNPRQGPRRKSSSAA